MIFYFISILFLFSLWYLKYSHKKLLDQNRPTSGMNIIAFGDSLTFGEGSTNGRSFVSVLSKRIGKKIINSGKNGDTTRDALLRLDKDVLSQEPRIVLLLLGGNDILQRIPKEETFRNLGKIIDKIRARGSAVLLLGVRGGIFVDHFRYRFHALAQEKNVPFVPDVLSFFLEPDLKRDYIHPNDQGYEIMASRIEPLLREMVRRYF